jgi:hypothetical protein
MVSETEVAEFLRRFCAAMARRGLTLWPRGKNRDFLLESGFTREVAKDVIRTLVPADYEKGPESDDNAVRPDGEVWVFVREFEGYQMYVKLKLGAAGNAAAECMSFHEAESEARRPLQRRR